MKEDARKDKSTVEALSLIREMVLPPEIWGNAPFSNDEVVGAVLDLLQKEKELATLQKKIYDSPHGTPAYLHQLIGREYCGLPDTEVFAFVLLDNATTDNASVEEQLL